MITYSYISNTYLSSLFELYLNSITTKRIKMSDYNVILAGLNLYPSLRQINEASNYAEAITIGYIRKIDPKAVVSIEDGDVEIYSTCDFKDLPYNAQCIFDSAFTEKLEMIQRSAR